MRLAQRAQQPAGERERLRGEEVGDGAGDFLAELRRTLVGGVGEDEEMHPLLVAEAQLLGEPRPVLAHGAANDRVAPDPGSHWSDPLA